MKADNGALVAHELDKLIRVPKGSPASDLLPRIAIGLALLEASKEYLWAEGGDAARLKLATEAFKVDAKKIGAEISKTLTEEFNKKRDAAKARKQLALEKETTPKPPKEKINKRRAAAAAK